jgi:hypothetical protein
MIDEIRPFLPPEMETEVFEISLHMHPQDLQQTLQHAIDESDGIYDPIYLGYGLCSKAVVGLVAKKSRLVVPRADDCMVIFLGSIDARQRELDREPGTYFLTSGYVGDANNSLFADHDKAVARYGEEKAEKLLRLMMAHYKRLVYIRMPGAKTLESDRAYSQNLAARFGMRYEEIEGTPKWLERMMQPELNEDFVVVEPGQAIELSHFVNLESNSKG